MITLKDEILAIKSVIMSVLPGVKTHLQTVPKAPKANDLVIRFQRGSTDSETGYHYRMDHEFQLVYFGTDNIDVLSALDVLSRKLNNIQKLEVTTGQFLTIGPFSMSPPFKTENDVEAAICVLGVSLRESREQPVYPKMNDVQIRNSEDVGAWQYLDGTVTADTSDDRTWEDLEKYAMVDLEKGVYLFEEEEE